MITDLDELVVRIEDPDTDEDRREELIAKLNIYGYTEERVREVAREYWLRYARMHIKELLSTQPPLETHLLEPEELRDCIEIAFQEYMARRKDLGIDDVRKFWAP